MGFSRPTTVRFSVLLLLYWAAMVSIEGFMVPYLSGMGFSEKQAGIVMAAVFLVSVISTPLWGYIADRTGAHRTIILIALAFGIAVVLAIPLSGTVFALVVLAALVYSLTANSMPALIDSWIMNLVGRGEKISYGIARGFGSFGFALSGAVLGVILDRHGLVLVFPIFAGLMAVVILGVATTGSGHPVIAESPVSSRRPEPPGSGRRVIGAVLSNGKYLSLLAAAFFLLLGTRAAVTFLPLRIYALGGTTSHVGWAQSINAASEIPFMFLSAFALRRVRPRALLVVAMSFFVVRLVLLRLAPTPETILAAQTFQGISFGFFLPASVHYINRIAPVELRSLFQTLAPSVYFGLASVVGSSVGGAVIERFGLDVLYSAAPVAAAIGVVVFVTSILFDRRRALSAVA